jgi:methionyl-tRNA synthetase
LPSPFSGASHLVRATLLQPILPRFAELTAHVFRLEELTWAGMEETIEEAPVEPYERLVDRVDPARIEALIAASSESLKTAAPPPEPPAITLDALVDSELEALMVKSVGTVASGKPGYVCLRLESAEEAERTVVARIGEAASLQNLRGQQVAVVTNLPDRWTGASHLFSKPR